LLPLEARFVTSSAFGDTYHVYARFDEPSILLNVFNVNWVSDANFYQYTAPPFNTPNDTTPPNSGLFPFAPGLEFDTYVTIGDTEGADGTDTAGDPNFVMGANTINGGWFDTNPTTLDGATDANFEVLIAQITVMGVVRGISGPMSGAAWATYKDAAGNTRQERFPTPPAPGTGIALLAGLGLSSRRRRPGE
jgi:hypothetical protein